MDSVQLRLWPTMSILEECLRQEGWDCWCVLSDPEQSYRGIRIYHRQEKLEKDVVYLIGSAETDFPADIYACVSRMEIPGRANRLICPERREEEILNRLLELFSRFQDWENTVDQLLYRNAGLQELCELGRTLLGNPVCIHDDWFVMMAITQDFAQIIKPEYLMSTEKGFVPRAMVEDFRDDWEYQETYAHRKAEIWYGPEKKQKTLYVNLWNGPIYKGRLLIARKDREFLQRDFLLAEFLAQRAELLLKNKQLRFDGQHQNMDDIIYGLLQGTQADGKDLMYLAEMLHWQSMDQFVCVRIQPQQPATSMLEHTLHNELFHIFPEDYILLDGHAQCLVINLSRSKAVLHLIQHMLSPLCRDYCLYAGISSPVKGLAALHIAYFQAGVALDQTFHLRSDKWILNFSACSLDYIVKNMPPPLNPSHLVAPELMVLMEHDAEKGTQYFETFREYLLQERDIPRTSEKLIIHRTTLLYRLKKIQSLIPMNLEDPWQRLNLILSYWMLEHSAKQ